MCFAAGGVELGAAAEATVKSAARSASVELPPVAAVAGAVAAMEALKALTRSLQPLSQWLHLDFAECEGEVSPSITVLV